MKHVRSNDLAFATFEVLEPRLLLSTSRHAGVLASWHPGILACWRGGLWESRRLAPGPRAGWHDKDTLPRNT